MERMKVAAEKTADKKQEELAAKEEALEKIQSDIKRYKKVSNQIRKKPEDQQWFDRFNYDATLTKLETLGTQKETAQKDYEVNF